MFGSGLDQFRIAHHHRNAERLFIGPPFVAQMMFAPEVAVIAGEDEEGIVELFGLFQCFPNLSDALVDCGQTAKLIADQILGRASAIPIAPYLPSRFAATNAAESEGVA